MRAKAVLAQTYQWPLAQLADLAAPAEVDRDLGRGHQQLLRGEGELQQAEQCVPARHVMQDHVDRHQRGEVQKEPRPQVLLHQTLPLHGELAISQADCVEASKDVASEECGGDDLHNLCADTVLAWEGDLTIV